MNIYYISKPKPNINLSSYNISIYMYIVKINIFEAFNNNKIPTSVKFFIRILYKAFSETNIDNIKHKWRKNYHFSYIKYITTFIISQNALHNINITTPLSKTIQQMHITHGPGTHSIHYQLTPDFATIVPRTFATLAHFSSGFILRLFIINITPDYSR